MSGIAIPSSSHIEDLCNRFSNTRVHLIPCLDLINLNEESIWKLVHVQKRRNGYHSRTLGVEAPMKFQKTIITISNKVLFL